MAMRSFEEIANLVAGSVAEVRPVVERMGELERPWFKIRLVGDAADLFFNASFGYRARYCISLEDGERANRCIVDQLLPQLVRHWRALKPYRAPWIRKSLKAPAAKAWILEGKLTNFPWRKQRVQLMYPPWVAAAKDWLRDKVELPHLQGHHRYREDDRLPFWGVRAPVSEWIEVKGAWIKEGASMPTTKPQRGAEIQKFGWT